MAPSKVTSVIASRTKRAKLAARNGSTVKPRFILKEGDWLDVMDGDGVWNVARVLSVPSPEEVEITYDGWTEEYDEVVRVDSNRVAPYHTFTWEVKCWVKYLNWPLWPSLITIRTPGTKEGIRNLAAERRVYVDFFDNPNFAKRDRCWQARRQVRTFEDNFDKKRTGSTGVDFERALKLVLQSVASTMMPKFALGALPLEYKCSPAESVETMRRKMGDKEWFQRFAHSQMYHRQNHVYETFRNEEDDASSDDSAPSTPKEVQGDIEEAESMEVPDATEEEEDLSDDLAPPTIIEVQEDVEDEGNKEIPDTKDDAEDESSNDSEPPQQKENWGDIEEGSITVSDTKNTGVIGEQTYFVFQDLSSNDNVKPQPCQQAQMLRDSAEAPGTEKLRSSRKTVFSVSRKFDVAPPPREPVWLKSRMASPPRLNLSTSRVRARAALTAPSTTIFSSSRGFSLESWFKRKLMADFINGESAEN